jgi:predicted anti-sigma-YlaC factor YlaD
MECEHYREAISARLDGEELGLSTEALDRHLTQCPACRAWADDVAALNRSVRVRPADPVPDLTPAILAALSDERGRALLWEGGRHDLIWRVGLVVVAMVQLALAVPGLISGLLIGSDTAPGVHLVHEMGSWDLALAVGLLFAAVRPLRAFGMLPFAAALVACTLITAGLDLADGHTGILGEAQHLLEVAGLAFLWMLARPSGTPVVTPAP